MIFLTSDTHGQWYKRFNKKAFLQQKELTKEDYVIVLGDFGIMNYPDEWMQLDWLDEQSFTTLFLAGNHSNYDYLDSLPVDEWHGGKVSFVRPSIIYMHRGQVYEINGLKFFAFGGASSHDIQDGILELTDPDYDKKRRRLNAEYACYRTNHVDWWAREIPSEAEMQEGWNNLKKHNYKVDYILTHCPYTALLLSLNGSWKKYKSDILTEYLQGIEKKVEYKHWYFGHVHLNEEIEEVNATCLYEQILKICD